MTAILVLDVGTTTLRAAVVDDQLDIVAIDARATPPSAPAPGLVEFDPAALAATALAAAREAIARSPEPPVAIGITNQRASTVVWDRATGEPIGPGIGWQDLRTVGACIRASADGIALAPNQSATKVVWLLEHHLDRRQRDDVCFGTIDSWLAWNLSSGAIHVTDHTNAAVTGLSGPHEARWSDRVLRYFDVPPAVLPTIVPSSGVAGAALSLPGAPPIAALVGDQQASLIGQGCVRPGATKITFGTGGMLDMCLSREEPASAQRSAAGTYPIVAWSHGHEVVYGLEAIMLSAGASIDWLCGVGIVEAPVATSSIAQSVDSAGGVVFVPALAGLGTPYWDFGATGTLLGITRGTTAAHVVRAVLDGVAHRGIDLIEAAVADAGRQPSGPIRIDGGMSANPTFVQTLADLGGRPIEVSPVSDATTLGAAFLAGLAVGMWDRVDQAAELWAPARIVDPVADRSADRARWSDAIRRSRSWIPELSALDF